LKVVVGESYPTLIIIDATDKNEGDVITYSLASGPAEVSVSAEGVVSWNPVVYTSNHSIVVSISDGAASSRFTPKVAICDCKNGGEVHTGGSLVY
jgi:hypothetical protein